MSTKSLSRRKLLGTGTAAAGALALGSQSSALAAPTGSGRGWNSKTQEEITLNVFVHDNHPFDRVKPLYEAMYPTVKLNMMKQNDVAILRATLAAEGDGTPDIFWPEIDMVQELGRAGVLLDTTELVEANKADLAVGKTAECFIPSTSKYAAFPGDVAVVGLYYRQDLLDQASVTIPETWTWDDFIVAGQQVKEATGASSLAIPSTGTGDSALLWSWILCQLGGAITNADGTEVTLDDEKGIAAMEIAKRLYAADISIDEPFLEENYFAEVAAGNVAIVPAAVWYRGFGIEPYVTDEQSGLGQWRVALLPSAGEGSIRTANYGGAAIASTIYTMYPDEVKNFMQLALGTVEGAAACGDWGILPPYLPYLASDAWGAVRSEVFGDFSFNEVWSQCVNEYPATWYKQPVFSEAVTTVGANILPILEGSVDAAEGLKAIGEQVRELNSRYQS